MTDKTASAADASPRAVASLLVRMVMSGGALTLLLTLTSFGLAAAETAFPAVLGRAIDSTMSHRAPSSWLTWLAALVAFIVACDAIDDLAAGGTVARSTVWLRRGLVRHVLALAPRAVERFGPGEIAGRLVGNAAHAGRVAPDVIRAAASVIPGLGALVALGLIDPWLCLTFLAGLPLLLAMVRRFVRDASEHAERYLAIQGRIAARLIEAVSGARTIAAAGTVDRETERVLNALPQLHREGVALWQTQRTIGARDALVVPLLEVAVLAVAGAELARGRITAGQFLAAGQYAVLATTLGSAATFVGQLVRVRAAARRAAEVLAQPPVRYGVSRLPPGGGQLEFMGVTLNAADRSILDRLDLVVPARCLVAVVGPTGAGKSALAALAGRLIDPDAGEVALDGVPLPTLAPEELRRAVSYAFERPVLVGETLADVIAFGTHRPSQSELVVAAQAARADGFIRRMPHGYLTRTAASPMSGGEVQRLSLARAFAHPGRVLILDDVAASLDTVTEHHINRALAEAHADRTRLVVAHRAATAAGADLVVWLDDRNVRAVGPHHELWAEADYRGLFEAAPESTPARSGSLAPVGSLA